MQTNFINIAKKCIQNGYSVLPINPQSKRPALETWERLKDHRLTEKECERAFYGDVIIARIGGKISGNLEMIDIDNHLGNAEKIFNDLQGVIDTFNLPCETTKNGGYHIFYKCSSPVEGSHKLARSLDELGKPTTTIETRAEGGYCVTSPSPGYTMINGDLLNIPVIDAEKREYILSECRSFNTYVKEENIPVFDNNRVGNIGDRLGDVYNNSQEGIAEAKALLRRAGWVFDKSETAVRRPGKNDIGYSATFGKTFSKSGGHPLFWVFSSNAYPFEDEHGYSPFSIFAILAHNGDYSSAASELSDRRSPIRKYDKKRDMGLPPLKNRNMQLQPQEQVAPEVSIKEQMIAAKEKKSPLDDVIRYLDIAYDFRFDIIKNIVQYKHRTSQAWEDCNDNDIYCELLQVGIKVKKEDLRSLLGSKYVPRYDAFKSYFEQLPKWDGKNWFVAFSDYITVDDKEFFTVMLEKQFVRAIKCALEPDFYNRFAFVLQSDTQEDGKSRLIQYFNPFGSEYYSTEFLTSNKDSIIALSENFIYNLDDLDDMNKQVGGMGKLKSLLAKSAISLRAPYGHQKVQMPRRCTFFGSTNKYEFLTDSLNTRWLIFHERKIDWRVFKDIDVHKMWAQAYAKYQDEYYEWDLTTEEKNKREKMNLGYKESSLEQEILAKFFVKTNSEYDVMSLGDIARRVSQLSNYNNRINLNLSYMQDLLKSMGFKEVSKVVNNTVLKWYQIRESEEATY